MAIRTKVEEKHSSSMRCCMNPLEECQGGKCMGWMDEVLELVKDPEKPIVNASDLVDTKTGFGYCGMVRG